jgi:hypothetical protein
MLLRRGIVGACAVGLLASMVGVAQAVESKKYPVYVVKSAGLSVPDTEKILSSLAPKMDDGSVVQIGSHTRFFSRSSMESGTRAVADPQGVGQPGQDDEKGAPVNGAEWDIDYLRSAPLVSPDDASDLLSKAFSGVNLGDSRVAFASSYTTLEIVGSGQTAPIFEGPIRTVTSRESSLSGLPVVGPGQSATVNFGSDGRVASLSIDVRRIAKTKKQVDVPVGAEAVRACRAAVGGNIKGAKFSARPVYLVSDQAAPGDSIPPVMECRMFGLGVAPKVFYIDVSLFDFLFTLQPGLFNEDLPGGLFEGRTTAGAYLTTAANSPLVNTGRETDGWTRTMAGGGVPVNATVDRNNRIERQWLESSAGSPAVVDQVDLAFVSTHGSNSGIQLNSGRDPSTAFTSWTWNWKLGQQDLEFLVLSACVVLSDDAASGRPEWRDRVGPAFGGLHMMFGADSVVFDSPSIGWRIAELTTGVYHGQRECRDPTAEEIAAWEFLEGHYGFPIPNPWTYCEAFRELTRGWDPGYFPIQWAYIHAFQDAHPSRSESVGEIRGAIVGTEGSAGIGGTAMDCLMCNLPDQDYTAGANLWRLEFGA